MPTLEEYRAAMSELGLMLMERNPWSEAFHEYGTATRTYTRSFPVRDPDDVAILAAALKSGATYLVTGARDLLGVDTGGTITIVNPRGLFDLLNENEEKNNLRSGSRYFEHRTHRCKSKRVTRISRG